MAISPKMAAMIKVPAIPAGTVTWKGAPTLVVM